MPSRQRKLRYEHDENIENHEAEEAGGTGGNFVENPGHLELPSHGLPTYPGRLLLQ